MRVLFRGFAGVVALLWLAGLASAAPVMWTLNNIVFDDGGTATGTFVFDADTVTPCSTAASPCGTFSSVNITTTGGGTLTGASYGFVCGQVASCTGLTPDSTGVLFLTSNVANQNGLRAIAFFFTAAGPLPPAGLTDAGGVIDVSDNLVGAVQESFCKDAACSGPTATFRTSVSGIVSTPEPASLALMLGGLAAITRLRRRKTTR